MSIYICSKCGRIYDEMPTMKQSHPYGEGSASETVANDMCRCGGDIHEAEQCKRCGGYFESYEVYEGLCIKCGLEMDEEEFIEWVEEQE